MKKNVIVYLFFSLLVQLDDTELRRSVLLPDETIEKKLDLSSCADDILKQRRMSLLEKILSEGD